MRLGPSVALLFVFVESGCQPEKADDSNSLKLASELVQCENDLSAHKEKIAELQAEIKRLKAASRVLLDPVTLEAGAARGLAHAEGDIPPEKLSAVIGRNAGGLRSCYERALKRNPGLQLVSSVNLRFAVKRTGEVQDVRLSPHRDTEMEQCMKQAVAKWKFPAFGGSPVEVETPINLVAKQK